MRASQPKAWPVECHVVSYRVAPHSCMAGRLDPLMWNIITLTFFIFVFSGILFDLILVHIPMLKWYIYSVATSCYVHVCRIHADPNSMVDIIVKDHIHVFLYWFRFSLFE